LQLPPHASLEIAVAPDKCRIMFEFQRLVAVWHATGQPPEISSVGTRERTSECAREKDPRFNSNRLIFITFAQMQLLQCPPHFSSGSVDCPNNFPMASSF
jgi:hypothetical protein